MTKTFIIAEIHDLLGQLNREEISFARMVEIMNEKADAKRKIHPLDESLFWVKWLNQSPSNGLNESLQSDAIRDLLAKVNEIIAKLNNQP